MSKYPFFVLFISTLGLWSNANAFQAATENWQRSINVAIGAVALGFIIAAAMRIVQ